MAGRPGHLSRNRRATIRGAVPRWMSSGVKPGSMAGGLAGSTPAMARVRPVQTIRQSNFRRADIPPPWQAHPPPTPRDNWRTSPPPAASPSPTDPALCSRPAAAPHPTGSAPAPAQSTGDRASIGKPVAAQRQQHRQRRRHRDTRRAIAHLPPPTPPARTARRAAAPAPTARPRHPAHHNATAQKYNGGCTSVARRSRAMAPSPACPASQPHLARRKRDLGPNRPSRARGQEQRVLFVVFRAAQCRGGTQQRRQRQHRRA